MPDLAAFATAVTVDDTFVYGGATSLSHSGIEVLRLGSGADEVLTGAFGDVDLGAGRDSLLADLPASAGVTYAGGSGSDLLTLLGTAGAVVDLILGTIDGRAVLSSFERLVGTGAADDLTGTGGANEPHGGGGGDTIRGGAGADTLSGGDGLDSLYGGTQSDEIHGGTGNDRIRGEDQADRLYGGNQQDRLFGGRANDSRYGGQGNDSLAGEEGADIRDGGDGTDRITGGAGADTMTGGALADTFVWLAAEDSGVGTGLDRLDLAALGPLVWIDRAAFGGTGTGEVCQVVGSGVTVVEIDTDGDGAEDLELVPEGVANGILDLDLVLA